MVNLTPLQLAGVFLIVLAVIGGGGLLIYKKANPHGNKQPRGGDVDRMFAWAKAQGWNKSDSLSLLGEYELSGLTVNRQDWNVKFEMTMESRFGGGKDNLSTGKLVPITRWRSSGTKPDKGILLIWPRPETMPSEVNGVPGAGMKIGQFNLGKFIFDTAMFHHYGFAKNQFDNAEIINLGTTDFKSIYAILSNNRELAEQVINEQVVKMMVKWVQQGYSADPPQILIWDRGIEITVFEKVADAVVLGNLVDLGETLVKGFN